MRLERFEFLSGRRGAGVVTLAVVAGIIASQIVLVLSAGSLGVPGILTVDLEEKPRDRDAINRVSDGDRPATRTTPPPIATPVLPDGAMSPPEQGEPASDVASPPIALPSGETDAKSDLPEAAPEQPGVNDAEGEAKPETPATGPIGWQGPEGGPGSGSKDDDAAVLDGPIDLNVSDALSDLNRQEAEEAEKEKKSEKEGAKTGEDEDSAGPASSAQPAPPPSDTGKREVLPWEAIEPDRELMAPVEVPEDTPAFSLPEPDTVKSWLQGRASNGPSGKTRYELWLEPPMEMRLQLAAVGYQFKPSSGEMVTRLSRRPESGFRVSYDESGCTGGITITLTYKDGRSHKVPVDGCSSFN